MKAIILAADEGTRLKAYTEDRPECLVKLGSKPLLAYQYDALRSAGIDEISVVTGYRADRIRDLGCRTFHNAEFACTGGVASLMCAAELLDGSDDVMIASGHVVYEASVVSALLECHEPISTLVDTGWLDLWSLRVQDPLEDAGTLKLDGSGDIRELGRPPRSIDDVEGRCVGLSKVRAGVAPRLINCYRELEQEAGMVCLDPSTMSMMDFLQRLIDDGLPVRAVPVKGGWLEVCTAADLELYRKLLAEERLKQFWNPETAHAR